METREERQAFLEGFAERVAKLTPTQEPPRTWRDVSKLLSFWRRRREDN